MDAIVFYAIWAGIILAGLALLGMIVFGLRSLVYGKINVSSIVMIALPLVLLVVLGLVMGDWALAAIWSVIIMFALCLVALLLSGVRGLFT